MSSIILFIQALKMADLNLKKRSSVGSNWTIPLSSTAVEVNCFHGKTQRILETPTMDDLPETVYQGL